MAIPKRLRDQLLVEARHRCTVCAEKCFEIHHIIERSQDGPDDDPDNLIVLCPNCHQHRYHRSGEFTPDQLRLYKQKLQEENEIERRLLLNLEEIRAQLDSVPLEDAERQLHQELREAAGQVSPDRAPTLHAGVIETSQALAERDVLRGGARKAIEVEFEVRRAQEKAQFPPVRVLRVDDDAWTKAPDFPAAYTLVFELDRTPHHTWARAFEHAYKQALYMMKRKTRLSGNRVTMIVADSDNHQAHADFAKRLVEDTNELIRTQYFEQIDAEINRQRREALEQFDTIRSLKARTKDIKL